MGKLTVEQERLLAALQDNVEVSAEVPAEVPVAELPAVRTADFCPVVLS